ncbi:MAG: hypothetical protein HFI86_05670 [Bacilli bacterium]|nr:hypothetical protein [Bacilli bacterium]
MEQSKLISSVIAKLRVAYPYYFKELDDDDKMLLGFIKMYQDQITGYNPKIVLKAIDEIIRTSKFMPTIAEIIEKCDSQSKTYTFDILEIMKKDGYFKHGAYGELDNRQAIKNYEKATMWINKGIIPKWLLEDMKKYGYVDLKIIGSAKNENIRLLQT